MPDGSAARALSEPERLREYMRRALTNVSRCRCHSGKRAAMLLESGLGDAPEATPPAAPTPVQREQERWRGLRALYGRHQLEALLVSATKRHNEKECQDGICSGDDRCLRHALTDDVATAETEIRGLLEERCRELGIDGRTGNQFVVDVLEDLVAQARRGAF